jgi:sodium-dependent dicarboxylate transporter 2/3/5
MDTTLASDGAKPGLTEDALPTAFVSPAEARFERRRRTAGLIAGPIAFIFLLLVPATDLAADANQLLAVMALVVIWWTTEAIPVAATALIGTSLSVLCGIAAAGEAFAPYASPTIFLFVGSFMIAQAITEHGLDRRLALAVVKLPAVAGDMGRIQVALGLVTLLLSGWMSNTATTAMMLPIALGVLGSAGGSSRQGPFAATFLLTIAYAASIGGMMTPVGSPPNLIALAQLETLAGIQIGFFEWMMLVGPISLVYGLVLCFLVPTLLRAGPPATPARIEVQLAVADRWTRGQVNCAVAFGVAVTLWVVPGVLAIASGPGGAVATVAARLDEGVVAIIAASLLFILPIDWRRRQFTLDWPSASKIDWGTILLFGGGLSLGQLMFSTGLAAHIGGGFVRLSGAESLWAITAVATLVALALSEVTSNTAAASMLLPVVLSIALAAGVHPVPPAIGTCLGASLAFMFPISTPPNALAYGTGRIPITLMIRYGLVMDLIGFVIIMLGLRLLCPVMGLA